jgi:cellulose synthase/poly-beta-1,6-N-acetylglucosamine synthase-like glycosyltransferase
MFELGLNIFFVIAVILIWFMIAYQLILSIAGYFHYLRSRKEKKKIDAASFDFPKISILIPAHNEEKVIGKTVTSMLEFDYPKENVEIIVINDGSSDKTGEIVENLASIDTRVRLFNVPPGEGGRGKSRALNLGLKLVQSELVAVFDADNRPEPSSLKYLVAELLLNDDLGAVLGKFRTINRSRNFLTRFINTETLSFQGILQAGRWKLMKVATLPGTNFVIRKQLLTKLGGWDESAITEDSELSIRIYMEGYKIKYIPYAITWEQEPESWRVWIGQRTRWVRGNNYVVSKFFKEIPFFKSKRMGLEILYFLLLYYVFLIAIVLSDIFFILGLLDLIVVTLPGPYTAVWILALVLFFLEIVLVLSYDKEDSLPAMLLIVLMYFTYCQFWIYIVGRALYLDIVRREKRTWVKTIRFDTPETPTR